MTTKESFFCGNIVEIGRRTRMGDDIYRLFSGLGNEEPVPIEDLSVFLAIS